MTISTRGIFGVNKRVYIRLNSKELRHWTIDDAVLFFDGFDLNHDNDTLCIDIPDMDTLAAVKNRYKAAKECGFLRAFPFDISSAKYRLDMLIIQLQKFRELTASETEMYDNVINSKFWTLMWDLAFELENHLECEIKDCKNQKRAHEEALAEIDAQAVTIPGKAEPYTCIARTVWHGRQLRLMESTVYGENAPCCIIDDAGEVVVSSTWDGFGILADIDDVDAESTPTTVSHPRTDYQVWADVSRGIHVRRPPHIKAAREGLIFRRSSSCPLRVTGACDIDSNFVYLYTSTHLFTVARATGEWACRRAGDGRYTVDAHERYRSRCTETRTLTLA